MIAPLHHRQVLKLLLAICFAAAFAPGASAQVSYNFPQSRSSLADDIPLAGAPVSLTMDCLAANGYGQWTSSSSTTDAHLLSNKLTTTATGTESGVLSSTPFTFYGTDVFPTTEVMKAAANLQGNVRYVWLQREATTDEFYIRRIRSRKHGSRY